VFCTLLLYVSVLATLWLHCSGAPIYSAGLVQDYGACYLSSSIKARTERRNSTELNWHGSVFDKLTSGQAGLAHWSLVVHERRHVGPDAARRCLL